MTSLRSRDLSLLAGAIDNNAAWCDAVCRALGCDTAWESGLWVNRGPSPPYYPNAVTLQSSDDAAQVKLVRSMLDRPLPRPWTVKDSFARLDLAPLGFEILFEAQWLCLPAGQELPRAARGSLAWETVTSDADLLTWEHAWRRSQDDAATTAMGPRLFQPALLEDPDVRFLAGTAEARIVAVAIAHRSGDGADRVVGISNIVLTGPDPELHRRGVLTAVRAAFPGLPVVGYESGLDLAAMLALGLRPLGSLRVWRTTP